MMKLVNIINIILTFLVCQSAPSFFILTCLSLLILSCKSKVLQSAVYFCYTNSCKINFSLTAARDPRRHHLQPTVLIVQVSISSIMWDFWSFFLFSWYKCHNIMCRQAHTSVSVSSLQWTALEGGKTKSGFFACHQFIFPCTPLPSSSSLIGVKRQEPAQLTQAPQSTT